MASDVTRGAPDAPPLPAEVMSVIRLSAGQLAGLQDAFTAQLHDEVAALIPGLPGGGRVFCERMVRVLLWAAPAAPHAAADALRQVGAAGQREGFPGARYLDVARALVRAVRSVSGNSWDNSMGSAWISYFQWAEPYLRAGAAQAAAEDAAAQRAADEQAAARRQAAQQAAAEALGHDPHGPQAADVDLEAVAGLLGEEDDDEDTGYGQIMLSMTRPPRRHHPAPPD